jgi:hypothetical protein
MNYAVAFPTNYVLAVKVDAPFPPLEIDKVLDGTFETFKEVVEATEPTKFVADEALLVLFHVNFGDYKTDVAAFPIKKIIRTDKRLKWIHLYHL